MGPRCLPRGKKIKRGTPGLVGFYTCLSLVGWLTIWVLLSCVLFFSSKRHVRAFLLLPSQDGMRTEMEEERGRAPLLQTGCSPRTSISHGTLITEATTIC